MKKLLVSATLILGLSFVVALPASAITVTTEFSATESHAPWKEDGGLSFTNSPTGNLKGIVNFTADSQPSLDYQTILQSDKPVKATIVFDQFFDPINLQSRDETLTLSYTFNSGPALDSGVTDGFALFTGELAGELINSSGFNVFLSLSDLQNGNTTGIFNFIAQLGTDGIDSDAMSNLGAPLSGSVTLQQTSVSVPAPSMMTLFSLGFVLLLFTERKRLRSS